jgi:DNA-binding transcriptional ArsR family regulator
VAKKSKARVTKKGRNDGEQYLKIPYFTTKSDVFRSLTGSALKVWIELRCRFNGGNNGELSLSMDEGARLLGMSKSTVQRAFGELEDKGFLKLKKRGQWYGRMATEWIITDRPYQGSLPTNDWKQWRKPKYKAKNRSSVP